MTTNKIARRRGKDAERYIARAVKGKRILQQGLNVPDVETAAFVYQVKERNHIPQWIILAMVNAQRYAKAKDKTPAVALVELEHRHSYILVTLEDWIDLTGG